MFHIDTIFHQMISLDDAILHGECDFSNLNNLTHDSYKPRCHIVKI